MTPLQQMVEALRLIPKYCDGHEAMPLRDVVVLLFVLDAKSPVTSSDVQAALQVDQPTTSKILGRLRSFSAITRFVDDRRRICFAPTGIGVELADDLARLMGNV